MLMFHKMICYEPYRFSSNTALTEVGASEKDLGNADYACTLYLYLCKVHYWMLEYMLKNVVSVVET